MGIKKNTFRKILMERKRRKIKREKLEIKKRIEKIHQRE